MVGLFFILAMVSISKAAEIGYPNSCPCLNWGDLGSFRQTYFLNSCIKHNGVSKTWEEAKTACNEYENGHLLVLDSEQEETEFMDILKNEWGAKTNGWYFWILRSADPLITQPMFYYIDGAKNESASKTAFYMCQYPITVAITCVDNIRQCAKPTNYSTECTTSETAYLDEQGWHSPWCYTTDTNVQWEDCYQPCELVDETKCDNLDSGSGWKGRTKFIWNSCLITSKTGATYEEASAKSACNQFYNGHLVILNTVEKENEFSTTMKEWGGVNGWAFHILSASDPELLNPAFELGTGAIERNLTYAFVCQYEADGQTFVNPAIEFLLSVPDGLQSYDKVTVTGRRLCQGSWFSFDFYHGSNIQQQQQHSSYNLSLHFYVESSSWRIKFESSLNGKWSGAKILSYGFTCHKKFKLEFLVIDYGYEVTLDGNNNLNHYDDDYKPLIHPSDVEIIHFSGDIGLEVVRFDPHG